MEVLGEVVSLAGALLSVSIRAWQHASSWLFLWPLSLIDIWLLWSLARTVLAREAFSPLHSELPGWILCVWAPPSAVKCAYTVLPKAGMPSASAQGCMNFSGHCMVRCHPSVGTSNSLRTCYLCHQCCSRSPSPAASPRAIRNWEWRRCPWLCGDTRNALCLPSLITPCPLSNLPAAEKVLVTCLK